MTRTAANSTTARSILTAAAMATRPRNTERGAVVVESWSEACARPMADHEREDRCTYRVSCTRRDGLRLSFTCTINDRVEVDSSGYGIGNHPKAEALTGAWSDRLWERLADLSWERERAELEAAEAAEAQEVAQAA